MLEGHDGLWYHACYFCNTLQFNSIIVIVTQNLRTYVIFCSRHHRAMKNYETKAKYCNILISLLFFPTNLVIFSPLLDSVVEHISPANENTNKILWANSEGCWIRWGSFPRLFRTLTQTLLSPSHGRVKIKWSWI